MNEIMLFVIGFAVTLVIVVAADIMLAITADFHFIEHAGIQFFFFLCSE